MLTLVAMYAFGIWGHIYTALLLIGTLACTIAKKEREPSVTRAILANLSLFAVILFWVLPI